MLYSIFKISGNRWCGVVIRYFAVGVERFLEIGCKHPVEFCLPVLKWSEQFSAGVHLDIKIIIEIKCVHIEQFERHG